VLTVDIIIYVILMVGIALLLREALAIDVSVMITILVFFVKFLIQIAQ